VPELVVPIRSRRRDLVQLFPKLQHVVPAAPLLIQGVARLRHEPHGWSLILGIAEVGISVLVVGAFLRQARAARSRGDADDGHHAAHAGHAVDWVDLLIGAMLGIEVWAHWHETGHIKRPTVVMAAGIFIVGLLHGKIAALGGRRLALKIDDAGLAVGGRPFQNFRATWDQLAAVEIEPARARLVRKDGAVRVFDFADLRNAAEVREALQGLRLRLSSPADDSTVDATPAPPTTT
jgi:hypothetical protein